jgi:hypothetical protein
MPTVPTATMPRPGGVDNESDGGVAVEGVEPSGWLGGVSGEGTAAVYCGDGLVARGGGVG